MLNQSFCDLLEYKICQDFKSCHVGGIEGFWCDGVLLSESVEGYSKKVVNGNKEVRLQAFIGKDGQTEF